MNDVTLDGRTLRAVSNSDAGEVDAETRLHFRQDGEVLRASYAGGDVVAGHLLGTFDGRSWDVRYVQLNAAGETATGHSVGEVTELEDGRVRVEDEWESRAGSGETVLVEVED